MADLVDPSELKVGRVEGPAHLIRRFRVRDIHPDAEIVVTDGACDFNEDETFCFTHGYACLDDETGEMASAGYPEGR